MVSIIHYLSLIVEVDHVYIQAFTVGRVTPDAPYISV
jgi:hypothetical protein